MILFFRLSGMEIEGVRRIEVEIFLVLFASGKTDSGDSTRMRFRVPSVKTGVTLLFGIVAMFGESIVGGQPIKYFVIRTARCC
jgi:hypothetical protein